MIHRKWNLKAKRLQFECMLSAWFCALKLTKREFDMSIAAQSVNKIINNTLIKLSNTPLNWIAKNDGELRIVFHLWHNKNTFSHVSIPGVYQ